MSLPRKLKNMNTFGNGESFLGQVTEVKLPVLTRKMEGYRGGGMSGEVDIDFGQEKLECEHKYGGLMRSILKDYGLTQHDGAMLRWVGAYQREDTGEVESVEVVMRGRHKEIDLGNAKPGDDTEFTVKSTLSYYKLSIAGAVVIEIDPVNMIEMVEGVDRLAAQRRAIGLA